MDDKHGKIVLPHQRKNNRELIPHQGQMGCSEADDRKLSVHFFFQRNYKHRCFSTFTLERSNCQGVSVFQANLPLDKAAGHQPRCINHWILQPHLSGSSARCWWGDKPPHSWSKGWSAQRSSRCQWSLQANHCLLLDDRLGFHVNHEST